MPRRKASEPVGLVDAVESGDRMAALVAVRRHLASALLSAETPNVAALARQLQAVLAEIDDLRRLVPVEADPLDELEKRRAARKPAAAGDGRAASGGVGRRRGGGAG